ncbi:MAG: hypothetical protein VCE91_04180, partial [Nitrospinota bacterium]
MILRWMAAGLMEAGKGFRRVRAYQGMARLSPALERNDERIDGKLKVEEAAYLPGAPFNFNRERDIPI